MSEQSVKKRRRVEEAEDTSGKKRKRQKQSTSLEDLARRDLRFTADAVYQTKVPTVIASSPGITVPRKVGFKSFTETQTATTRRQNGPAAAASQKELLLHSTAHPTMDYTARENNEQLNHYIAIVDPETGKMQLLQGRKMLIRGNVKAQQASEEDMHEQPLSLTISDMRTELGQAFGTKKAKKAIAAVTENAIAPRRKAGDKTVEKLGVSDLALMATIKDAAMSVPTKEALQNTIDAAKPVPKQNPSADRVQDVYQPGDIIGRDILDSIPIKDWTDAIRKKEEIKAQSRYVAHRIVKIGSGIDSSSRLRLLRYLYWVILFFILSRKGKERGSLDVPKKDILREKLEPAPPAVIDHIRKKFSDNGTIRKFHRDLLMTHCCVFSCILDDFSSNNWDLKEDLKIEQKEINQYFMEIGALIRKTKVNGRTDSIAVLRFPLTFPRVRIPARGR